MAQERAPSMARAKPRPYGIGSFPFLFWFEGAPRGMGPRGGAPAKTPARAAFRAPAPASMPAPSSSADTP